MAIEATDTDWEALRYFLAAARAKSLAGAARALGVEHTTVGRRISALERALGASLVDRGPAGLELTRLGQRVLRRAVEMERAALAVAALATSRRSELRLVVPTGFTALLSPHLDALQARVPSLALEIVSSGRRSDLRKREADLALRVGPVEDETLIARKLGEVGSALYASRAYLARWRQPIDIEDLEGHSVIGFHESLARMPAAEWLAARSSGARVVLRSREAMDMLAGARSGAGLAVLPCFLGDADAQLVRLSREPIARRRLSLVYRRDAALSREARAVIGFLVEILRGHSAELRGMK